jgi:transposase-like protein
MPNHLDLNLRVIESLLAERGMEVRYEALRLWCIGAALILPAGQAENAKYMVTLSSLMRSSLGFRQEQHCLWRGVDQESGVMMCFDKSGVMKSPQRASLGDC